jgi:hypothetical protein
MLGSVSHMAQVGTEHYITDWVRSRWWIRDRLGENIIVLPLAPIFVDGLYGKSVIRSMVEVISWFIALSATEAVLMKSTLQSILDTQFRCTEGQGWQADRQCFRLPAGLDTKATVAFVSDGWGSWPDCIPPVPQAAEREIIMSLLAVLTEAFDLNLDLDPCLARSMADISEQKQADATAKYIVVIGNSHARRLTEALEDLGCTVRHLSEKGWKLTKANVDTAVSQLADLEDQPDLIIFQGLDNNAFFVAKEDGSLSVPSRGTDRKYHVDGELRVANKDQTIGLMKIIRPLLEAEDEVPKIVILPIPRYSLDGQKCCTDNDHCTNSGPNLASEVRGCLASLKRTVRSFMFNEKIRGVKLLDPIALISTGESASYADPVHLVQDGYACLAAKVTAMLAGTDTEDKPADPSVSGGLKRDRSLSQGGGQPPKRGRGQGQRGRYFGGRGKWTRGQGSRGRKSF